MRSPGRVALRSIESRSRYVDSSAVLSRAPDVRRPARDGIERERPSGGSDDPHIVRRNSWRGLERGDELRGSGARAIGVVIELPGARVVDEPVVGIVTAGRARRGIEARVAGGEVARGASP